MVNVYASLLALMLATSSVLAFPLPEGKRKVILREPDLNQKFARRESWEYLLVVRERNDGLEARAFQPWKKTFKTVKNRVKTVQKTVKNFFTRNRNRPPAANIQHSVVLASPVPSSHASGVSSSSTLYSNSQGHADYASPPSDESHHSPTRTLIGESNFIAPGPGSSAASSSHSYGRPGPSDSQSFGGPGPSDSHSSGGQSYYPEGHSFGGPG